MIEGDCACEFFLKIKLGWRVFTLISEGISSGTLVTWNPMVANFRPFVTCASILLSRHVNGFDQIIHIINVYAPCREHKRF